MTRLLKKSFVWQFAGGFLIGAAGLAALNTGEATPTGPYTAPYAATQTAR